MGNKITVLFDDQEGGTYELNIDLDRLSKDGMLSTTRGMGHIVKKKQHFLFVENDPGRLPEEIFGDVKGMNCHHLLVVCLLLKMFVTRRATGKKDLMNFITQNLYIVQEVQIHLLYL